MIEILLVGDELLSGSTLDKNAGHVAGALYEAGLTVSRITMVGDEQEDIERALHVPLDTTRFVIVTGGLGPTEDDRTACAAASAFDRKLLVHPEALALMEARFRELQRAMNPANRKQAVLPEDSIIIPNPVGTACGFIVTSRQREFLFLPGVPEEVRAITKSFIVEHIKEKAGSKQIILNKTLKVFGIFESMIQEKLTGVLPPKRTVALGFYPQYPEISLKITARGTERSRVEQDMQQFQDVLYEHLGDYIYSENNERLEEVVGDVLTTRQATLAVAESCTGGLVSHHLTNVSGSSRYLERSFVVYSNESKAQHLEVPPDCIEQHGAVSEPVARHMAEGVRRVSRTTFGLAVTGIAGPTGGSPNKPVGTVYIGVASKDRTEVKKHQFHGTRERIKMMSAHMALNSLRRFVLEG